MTLVVTAAQQNTITGSNPCPSVLLTITGIVSPIQPTYISVWRYYDGKLTYVRNARSQVVLGTTMSFTDYEAPFGVPLNYIATVTAFSYPDVTAQSSSITLDVADCWITDPISPRVSARVNLGRESLGSISYVRDGSVIPVSGSSLPVLNANIRQEGSAIPFVFIVHDIIESTQVTTVLQFADPFLLRTPPEIAPLPRQCYLTASQIERVPIDLMAGGSIEFYRLTGDRVTAPTAPIAVETRTYQDVLNEANTYSDVLSQHVDYLGLLRG